MLQNGLFPQAGLAFRMPLSTGSIIGGQGFRHLPAKQSGMVK